MNGREEAAQTRGLLKQAVTILLSVIAAIVVGLVPSWTHVPFTVPQQIFLSILTFMIFVQIDLLWLATQTASVQEGRRELWRIEDEGDRHLFAIRSAFATIVKRGFGPTDLFVHHLLEELERLESVANDAANKGDLRVTGHHLTRSEHVLGAFGGAGRILRYTWRIDPGDRLFGDLHWRKYFELTSMLAASGKIEAIRAVLVVKDRSHLGPANVQMLLGFFATQKGLCAKSVLTADYEALAGDNEIPGSCIEFGIYGDRLLYQAEHYTPSSVGIWSKDSAAIRRFCRFFDALWDTETIAATNPAPGSGKPSLAELMEADEAVAKG